MNNSIRPIRINAAQAEGDPLLKDLRTRCEPLLVAETIALQLGELFFVRYPEELSDLRAGAPAQAYNALLQRWIGNVHEPEPPLAATTFAAAAAIASAVKRVVLQGPDADGTRVIQL